MVKIAKNIFSKLNKNPYHSILMILLFIYIICSVSFYNIIPYLLNYPPNSINTPFQLTINPTYYWVYYLLLCIVCVSLVFVFSAKTLYPIKNLQKKDLTLDEKLKIRKVCTNFSIGRLLLFTTILPCAIVLLILLILNTDFILTLKICLLVCAFLGIPNVIFYTCSNIILKNILIKTFDKEVFENEKLPSSSLWKNIVLQVFPPITISIIFLFMMFTANFTNEIGNNKYILYKDKLNNILYQLENSESIKDVYNELSLLLGNENWFIKVGNEYLYPEQTTELSNFMKNYIDFYAKQNNSKIYDSYGLSNQGIVSFIDINNQKIAIGITYDTLPMHVFLIMIITLFLLLLVDYIIIFTTSSVLGNDIRTLAEHLFNISKSNTIEGDLLPITSTDELAFLTTAFNEVQKTTKKNIDTIKSSQDQLIEQERLASLGQMIGGIAHNLKTPIMSISGASEGIRDLVNEFDASIGNPVVTNDDFHDIAKEMNEWIDKIKSYTEYMSDVITAVKGQATALTNESNFSFTITELFKRVNILMKHELKKAVIYLNITTNVDENTIINGDINNLIQVINNMISNSIQAYNGVPEQQIDLMATKQNNNIVISIKDYGPGLPSVVKNKLFKEMITTKGKNGTGLGLYMSYSNIKAHFNGDITFESKKGKGTQFNIIIPI